MFQIEWDRTMDMVLGCVCLILSLLATLGNLASLIYVKINWNVGNKVHDVWSSVTWSRGPGSRVSFHDAVLYRCIIQ